jgi:RNA polymerase sigma-70 factor (ECF subfamily)
MNVSESDSQFTGLFERYHDDVLAYCTRRIARSEADDVAAEVFAIAWRRIDEVDWETVKPWLYGIAQGVLANRWRSLRRRSRLTTKLSGLGTGPEDSPELVVVRREQDAEVMAAVNGLKVSDREVLMLSAWEDLTAPEIAITLGISTSAAEQRLHRAKRRFAKVLDRSSPKSHFSPRAAGEGGGH